jgi:outer membrane biosynthesis protein TonB
MRDARFILILTAVAVPVAAWLTFEALVAPDQPPRHTRPAKDQALLAPVPPAQPQPPQVVEPTPQPVAAAKVTPPRPADSTTAAVRKREVRPKSGDATNHGAIDANGSVPLPPTDSDAASIASAALSAAQPPTIQAKARSPEELCADRSNFITRNLCEIRACSTAEWSAHPSCVKRRELEERNRPGSIMGSGG